MTIASKLETINEALGDIKSSIVAKGVIPTGDITTYSTAIDNISGGGDEITATNTTGSAVSADDRVWVNGEDVYTQNFTAVGSPTVDSVNKTVTMTSGNQYIYKQESFTPTKIEFVIKYKISSLTIKNSNILLFSTTNNALDASYKGCAISFNSWTGLGYYPALYFNSTQLDNTLNSYKNISVDTWVWLKGVFYNGTMTLYGSFDGSTWDTLATSSYSGTVYCNGYWIKGINNNTFVFDLSECYVKYDDEIVWTPYTKTGTNYSIINDTDITSTSFTGIAQANIANNATGSIKTLLDGNGTYAPTTTTKTITTNGTYTASAENAYGFSSVTVDVPSAPTKKYNLLDRVKDDSNNEIGTVSGFFTDANNVEYAVVCLDAQYRLADSRWCSNNSTTIADFLPGYEEPQWGPLEAKETATYNTQKILDFCAANSYTSQACSHCRSKSFTIDGTTYYGQLPNVVESNDIVKNHTAINTVDTTASSYSSVNFSTGHNMWSSSRYDGYYIFYISLVGTTDVMAMNTPDAIVAPVLEIPNT